MAHQLQRTPEDVHYEPTGENTKKNNTLSLTELLLNISFSLQSMQIPFCVFNMYCTVHKTGLCKIQNFKISFHLIQESELEWQQAELNVLQFYEILAA